MLVTIMLLGTIPAMSDCSLSLPQGNSGSVALIPFWDEEQGIQGVTTPQDWADQAELVQLAIPGTREEAVAIVLERTSLAELPPLAGTYRGKAFAWDLYAAELQIHESGPQTLHAELGLAEGEGNVYLVVLVTLQEVYAAKPALYETIFRHTLYALEPLK